MFILAVWALASACTDSKKNIVAGNTENYTCPMHPQIVQHEPGTCPICAMDLVPAGRGGAKNQLSLNDEQLLLANVKTMKLERGQFGAGKVLNARLVANPEATEVISSHYQGRIERLFVKEAGIKIRKGQPIFQIYSESLQTLQLDYLLQVKQAAAFPDEKIYKDLKEAARNKLKLFGLGDAQIQALLKNGKTSPVVTVYSPASGVVSGLQASEGQYLNEGSVMMQIDDYSSLWVEADVYPQELGSLSAGATVKVVVQGLTEPLFSQINFIGPEFDASSQIINIRASLTNEQGLLQPGMHAQLFLPLKQESRTIKLPLDAVLRDGHGAHVWIKTGNNKFAPRMVQTGAEDDTEIVISSGLTEGEEVVVSGAYLLYSEFVLKHGGSADMRHASM